MTLLKHSAAYLLARGLPALINFGALALFTRLLAPEEYGRYALVIAVVSLANAVLFQWLRLGLLRFLPQYSREPQRLLSTLVAGFVVLVATTGALAVFAFLLWADPVARQLISLGVLLLWAQAWFQINLETARSQLSPKRYGYLNIAKSATSITIGGVLAFLGWGANGIILGLVVAMLANTFVFSRSVWAQVHYRLIDTRVLSELLRYGLPLTMTFALTFVVSSSDRLLLAWLLDTESVGLYAVGYDLAQHTLGVLMMVVNLAAYPLAVRALEQQGEAAAQRQLAHNATLLLMVALPATAGMVLLSDSIAGVFLGAEFHEAAALLIPWIAIGAMFAGIKAYHFDLSFQLGKSTIKQTQIVFIAAIANVLLNVLLIPRFGILGAAYATVIAYFTAIIGSWLLGRTVFAVPVPLREWSLIGLATGFMALVLIGFRSIMHVGLAPLIAQVALGVTAFVLAVFLFGLFSQSKMTLKVK
jgi:O-antigen/teichoic acid export membrane protein